MAFQKIKVQILFLDTRVVDSACVRGGAAALFTYITCCSAPSRVVYILILFGHSFKGRSLR
jgi:hypothetical protein